MDIEREILREEIIKNFDSWRKAREDAMNRGQSRWHLEGRDDFVQAWANIAYVAELERDKMGRELNKLQQRIGRQRKANRKLREKIEELEQLLHEKEWEEMGEDL